MGNSNLGQRKELKTEITVNIPTRIFKCWVMVNERLSLNFNFFISEMGTINVPQWIVMQVAKRLQPRHGAWEIHSVSQFPVHSPPMTNCFLPLCICREIVGLREITDTSTFYSRDSMLDKFSHSLEQRGKGPMWIILQAIQRKPRCLARHR